MGRWGILPSDYPIRKRIVELAIEIVPDHHLTFSTTKRKFTLAVAPMP